MLDADRTPADVRFRLIQLLIEYGWGTADVQSSGVAATEGIVHIFLPDNGRGDVEESERTRVIRSDPKPGS